MNKKTLVFGASLKPQRYSNIVINKLINANHDVVAYGLRQGDVNGVKVDDKIKKYENIDTVTLYLNPKRQEQYYSYIVSLKPNRVIFNPGTVNPEFFKILRENNIAFEAACTLTLLATNQY